MSESTAVKHTIDVPLKLYSPKEPFEATVNKVERLTELDSANDVRHIEISLKGSRYRYVEGQSVGVLPPGLDANGKPHKLRLYSIASPAVGDDGNAETLSVCVKRANFTDENGVEYKGVCSNFLCDIQPGDKVNISGPAGIDILMPDVPNANIIMVATGTGIAPFRAFLKKRYTDLAGETGQAWMIFGMQTQKDYLYGPELEAYNQHDTYKLVTAFSREQKTADGKRLYVQHRVAEHAATILAMLKDPQTYFYICGLRGMETGILEALSTQAQAEGLDWDAFFADLKAQHRWRVEVY